MTSRHRRTAAISLLTLVTLVPTLAGCSGDDATGKAGSSTTAATKGSATGSASSIPTFSSTPSAEWGPLAACPIEPESADPGGTPADEGVDGVVQFGKLSQDHVDPCVDYPVHPAVGGAHFRVWANCGFYTAPVPEMAAVHVLEHGGVWIAFDPTLDAAEIRTIRAAADATTHVLASPYPGLTSKVVMSAWSRQLRLDSTSDPRFQTFIDTYLQGPNTPELGAACDGGIGTPEPKA